MVPIVVCPKLYRAECEIICYVIDRLYIVDYQQLGSSNSGLLSSLHCRVVCSPLL